MCSLERKQKKIQQPGYQSHKQFLRHVEFISNDQNIREVISKWIHLRNEISKHRSSRRQYFPAIRTIQFFQSLSEQIYRVSPFLHEIKTFTIILILHGKFSPILFVAVVCCFPTAYRRLLYVCVRYSFVRFFYGLEWKKNYCQHLSTWSKICYWL